MNRIKSYLNSLGRSTRVLILALAVVVAGAGVTQAATTISTNILTNGTLGVTGVSTFGATASTTISTAGVLTAPSALVNGALSAIGLATFGATASTTISTAGALTTPSALVNGALNAIGVATFGATASTTVSTAGLLTTPAASTTMLSCLGNCTFGSTATSSFTSAGVLTLQNGETISNATDGTITLTAATTTVTGDLRISPNGRIYVHPTLADKETGEYINQAIKADVTLGSTFGASDSSDEWFGSAIRSRLMGSNLTGANNTVAALEGSYQITGTNASTYPKGAVLGEIGGNSTTADGAFVAYTDGDVGTLNSAGAAFKIMNNNNAASGSKFNYGLDIFDAGHAGLAAVTLGVADIRMVNGDTISNTAAASTTVMSGAFRAASLNFANATAVAGTGDAITIDFTPDFPALAAGEEVTFISEAANTGATTLAIDGGTAKAITKTGGAFTALSANDIKSGQVVKVVYDGTRWQMISPLGQ